MWIARLLAIICCILILASVGKPANAQGYNDAEIIADPVAALSKMMKCDPPPHEMRCGATEEDKIAQEKFSKAYIQSQRHVTPIPLVIIVRERR